jgi:hypothetical protein
MLNMMSSKGGEEFNPPQFMIDKFKAKMKDGFVSSPEILELINSQESSGVRIPKFLVELIQNFQKQEEQTNE